VAPNRACRAGPQRRTIAESFVDLSRRVRPLDDFDEIPICPYGKMHVQNRANSLLYTRAQPAKTLTTESGKNSSTTMCCCDVIIKCLNCFISTGVYLCTCICSMPNHVFFIYTDICPTINKLIIDIDNKNHKHNVLVQQ